MKLQGSFNPPGASHRGGVWEWLIRSVRKVLHSVLRQQTLNDEGLQTILCEVEAILNSRPITTVSSDPRDLEPLTPNHILLLKTKPILPPGIFEKNDLYVRRCWRQVQYMANLFWKRWSPEYLPLMQERQKWCTKRRSFTPGDVVMVVDSSAPRGSWVLGRVLEGEVGLQRPGESCQSQDTNQSSGETHNKALSAARRHRIVAAIRLQEPIEVYLKVK